jgi:hypothetical protein
VIVAGYEGADFTDGELKADTPIPRILKRSADSGEFNVYLNSSSGGLQSTEAVGTFVKKESSLLKRGVAPLGSS